jgi:hypothetical protein
MALRLQHAPGRGGEPCRRLHAAFGEQRPRLQHRWPPRLKATEQQLGGLPAEPSPWQRAAQVAAGVTLLLGATMARGAGRALASDLQHAYPPAAAVLEGPSSAAAAAGAAAASAAAAAAAAVADLLPHEQASWPSQRDDLWIGGRRCRNIKA